MVISLLCSARNDGMTCGVLFAAEFTSCGNKEHSLKAVPLDWLIAKSRRIDIMPINDVLVRTYILYIFFIMDRTVKQVSLCQGCKSFMYSTTSMDRFALVGFRHS